MISEDGPKVIEFNVRFGDPETQSILFRMESDLLNIIEAVVDNKLDKIKIKWSEDAACCVVMASEGYPGEYVKGREIKGIDKISDSDVFVFHAGTAIKDGKLVTNGGRVLGVTARGANLEKAKEKAFSAVEKIHFDGAQYRKDIGKM